MFEPNYIAVEGVIGVGKTTFAQMLAQRIEADLVNEEVFENPFLVDYYKNRARYALSCQLYFLISRFQQQQQLMVRDLFAQRIVADYLFAKDAIFASVALSERELTLYNKIAPALSRDIPRPDLVIYLQAGTQTLLSRIRKRGFSFEKAIDSDYIEMLNKAYDYFFFHYSDTPLLVVKTDEIDFVNTPEHFDDLIEQIHKPISGKKYYVPAGDLARK
ncbi:deoxynucleoside kinase [candidate division GN15 bacterium]|uniref:Deoxynucleoside kinase n=1 Tax=candidate division GN15 bacterium TaxID=2072418 RepID=A0A855WVI4_9BACT|nr:MAG: deoxynucleoside kinase [candidate division GN15 bacterium]